MQWIADFRSECNEEDENSTWQQADLMTEYIRQMDPGTRRMKFNHVRSIVERGEFCSVISIS